MSVQKLSLWILAFRPKTLTASLVPVAVATAYLSSQRALQHVWISWCALAAAFCIQIATNLVNDALDAKKGADTPERLGPMRVTQSGHFSSRAVLRMAFAFVFAAAAFGVPLVIQGGWPILLVGVVAIGLAYAYTGGPVPLAYHGLGDVFVLLFFGWVAVGGVAWLHTHTLVWGDFVLGLQVGLLGTALIAINNLRDVDTDRKVSKNTLAVVWGKSFVRWEIAVCLLLPVLLQIFWWWEGFPLAALLGTGIFPLSLWLTKRVWTTPPGPAHNGFLAVAALIQLLFGVFMALGFLL